MSLTFRQHSEAIEWFTRAGVGRYSWSLAGTGRPACLVTLRRRVRPRFVLETVCVDAAREVRVQVGRLWCRCAMGAQDFEQQTARRVVPGSTAPGTGAFGSRSVGQGAVALPEATREA